MTYRPLGWRIFPAAKGPVFAFPGCSGRPSEEGEHWVFGYKANVGVVEKQLRCHGLRLWSVKDKWQISRSGKGAL